MQKVNWGQVLFVSILILLASLSRVMPHLENFTPVIAITLFAGVTFRKPLFAFLIPFIALLLSDSYLGFYQGWQLIYACYFAVIAFSFLYVKAFKNAAQKVLLVFFGPLVFFLTTNAVVWQTSGMYSLDISGLWQSYVMALPFFKATFISTLFYSVVLFGVCELYKRFIKVEELEA